MSSFSGHVFMKFFSIILFDLFRCFFPHFHFCFINNIGPE